MTLASINVLSLATVIYLANVALASVVACGTALIALRIYRKAPLPLGHAMLVVALVATLAGPLFLALPHASFSPFAFDAPSNTMQSRKIQLASQNDDRAPAAKFDSLKPVTTRTAPNTVPTQTNKPAAIAVPASPSAPLPNVSAMPSRISWPNMLLLVGNSIALLWLIGSAWACWQLARGCLQLRRLIKSLQPLASPDVEAAAAEAARQLGHNRPPTIRQSALILGPLSLGLFQPLIVVPTDSSQSLTADQLRGMLLHEIAHIIRHDHLVGVLQRLAVTLFWWNPLVHRVSQRISSIREQICDDVATTRIESADSYADMLVDLASRVGRLSLPTTIGIFENSGREFTQRITRLLNPTRPIVTSLDRRMKFISGATLTATLAAILTTGIQVKSAEAPAAVADDAKPVSPFQTFTPETNAAPSDHGATKPKDEAPNPKNLPAIKWPAVLYGTIKTPDGKPLAGASVRLDVTKIHQYLTGQWDESIHKATITTGANGEYRFDTSKLPETTHRPFSIKISCAADGFADAKTWTWYDDTDKSIGEHFQDLKLKASRVVRGRCVDRNGNPIAGAVIKVASDNGPGNWAWDPRATDSDGHFEVSVPANSQLAYELWFEHPKWAPQHVAIPKDGNELADIRLQQGARVKGSVLKSNGKPAPGVVVAAESVFSGNLKSVSFPMKIAVKTDANGNYELPPLAGIFKVSLRQAAETDDRLSDRFVVADGPPPLVLPQRISASGTEPQTLDFHAGPTLTVRGTIRWADGRPVAGTEVWATYLPDNNISTELGRTHTDDQGNYSFDVPRPIDSLFITGMGAFDKNRKWCYAYGDTKVPVQQQGIQDIRLNELKDNVEGLNFVVRPEKPDDPVKATPGQG